MEDSERDELRRLATWLSRRRAVDEAVASLTAYGPAAGEQVFTHLEALKRLLAAEQEAFAAVEEAAPRRPQSPLPHSLQGPDAAPPYADSCPGPGTGPDATVHSLVRARERQHR